MTREEEIINAGVEYTESKRPRCIGGDAFSKVIDGMNRNPVFEDAAKWADKTMIEKACEWISIYYPNIDRMGIDKFITVFRKAMEE